MAWQTRIALHRTVLAMCMLGCSALAMAEPLYRWTEADGSITFSPTKPAAGIEYTIVDKSAPGGQVKSPVLIDTPVTSTALRRAPEPLPQVQYAPNVDDLQQPSARADQPNTSLLPKSNGKTESRLESADRAAPVQLDRAQNTKRNRCEDLRKRVVSLERRLKSRLTPEDMDNTVIHMARYQRSFNQHCVQ